MGTIQHHAIVVTSDNKLYMELAHRAAYRRFPWVSPLSPQVINGYSSFFIPPDGSKEYRDLSDEGDTRRQDFIDWLNAQADSEGASYYTWVEIEFGAEGYDTTRDDNEHYLETQARIEQEKADAEADAKDKAAAAEAAAEARALAGASPSDPRDIEDGGIHRMT